ncbi:MAG: Cytochrome c551 peroxidase [Flavobacteriales bacterium UBA4585]|nr:MAG: Cytochrome c551 peroxidase [Flavobacteriales bacterium UBA4585]
MLNKALFFSITLLVASGCAKAPEPVWDTASYTLDFGGLPEPELPADNPLTEQGVKLGRMLFYETRLSGDNSMACASCHKQENAFTDTNRFSTGIDGLDGHRQAMSAVNMLWNTNGYFWDGRAQKLRDQSIIPIQDVLEMNETMENVVEKLEQDTLYTHQFFRAFGSEDISSYRIGLALEQFMNSIVSYRSKYDLFLDGEATFTEEEELGMELFFEEYNPYFPETSGADCGHCHGGKNFSSQEYMNNGLDSIYNDDGRYDVTGLESDRGAMKVTTLRNIELTPPYMHDGRFNTLEEVIDHYNEGLRNNASLNPALAMTMGTGLMLNETDKDALIAFLKTLTDTSLIQDSRYASPF